eukprot:7684333-Alexandrium_andersonii.AAC.1
MSCTKCSYWCCAVCGIVDRFASGTPGDSWGPWKAKPEGVAAPADGGRARPAAAAEFELVADSRS